jgi:hypothetical protein
MSHLNFFHMFQSFDQIQGYIAYSTKLVCTECYYCKQNLLQHCNGDSVPYRNTRIHMACYDVQCRNPANHRTVSNRPESWGQIGFWKPQLTLGREWNFARVCTTHIFSSDLNITWQKSYSSTGIEHWFSWKSVQWNAYLMYVWVKCFPLWILYTFPLIWLKCGLSYISYI